MIKSLVVLILSLYIVQQPLLANDEPCELVCVDALITTDDQWIMQITDSSGRIHRTIQTDVPANEPLDLWLENMSYPIAPGEYKQKPHSSKTGAPNPPPSGTGTVVVSTSEAGIQDGEWGYYMVNIQYHFVDNILMDVDVSVTFVPGNIPPPWDGAQK